MSSKSNTHADVWIAGAVAAFTVDLLVYPLDTLKTRLQSQNYERLYVDPATRAVNRAALTRGLYQGVGSVIIATLPSSGAFFTTYEATKSSLSRANSSYLKPLTGFSLPQPLIHSAASSIAELVSCAILTPAEVIKQNAQMVNTSHSSSASTVRNNNRNRPITDANATLHTLRRFRSNPLALWRGYSTLAGRNLPFTALQFPLFEKLREHLRRARRRRNADMAANQAVSKRSSGSAAREGSSTTSETAAGLSLLENGAITAISAGLAGSLAAVVTTPIDVVKTRVMLSAFDSSSSSKPTTTITTSASSSSSPPASQSPSPSSPPPKPFQVAREILARDGPRGLWRGGALRAVWTMLGSGLYLGAYECVRAGLADRRERRKGEMEM